jgi:hypothetical protein
MRVSNYGPLFGVVTLAVGRCALAQQMHSSCSGLGSANLTTQILHPNTTTSCQVMVAQCWSPNANSSGAGTAPGAVILPPATGMGPNDSYSIDQACSGLIPGALLLFYNKTIPLGVAQGDQFMFGNPIQVNSFASLQEWCSSWSMGGALGCSSFEISTVNVYLNNCNGSSCSVASASGGVQNPWAVANAFNSFYGPTIARGTGFQNLSEAYGEGVEAGLEVNANVQELDNVTISFPDSQYASPSSTY